MIHSSIDVLFLMGAMKLTQRLRALLDLAHEQPRMANRAMRQLGPAVVKQAFLEFRPI